MSVVRYERDGPSRNKGPKNTFSKRSNRNRSEDRPRKRDSLRGHGRNKSEIEMTEVTCSSCGITCEVPFKPTSSKPVYCRECFGKNDKSGPNKSSNRDLDIINEKLNKIMTALQIE